MATVKAKSGDLAISNEFAPSLGRRNPFTECRGQPPKCTLLLHTLVWPGQRTAWRCFRASMQPVAASLILKKNLWLLPTYCILLAQSWKKLNEAKKKSPKRYFATLLSKWVVKKKRKGGGGSWDWEERKNQNKTTINKRHKLNQLFSGQALSPRSVTEQMSIGKHGILRGFIVTYATTGHLMKTYTNMKM